MFPSEVNLGCHHLRLLVGGWYANPDAFQDIIESDFFVDFSHTTGVLENVNQQQLHSA